MRPVHLVLNAGSSSLKFQVFDAAGADRPECLLRGLYQGLDGAPQFRARDQAGEMIADRTWPGSGGLGHEQALDHLAGWLQSRRDQYRLEAVGHRVVHGGMAHAGPVRVDREVIEALESLVPLAPLHQPHNLAPIRLLLDRDPDLPQVACFDTSFHRDQPETAQLYALPRDMIGRGVRRYGFHGLSYAYLAGVLPEIDPALAAGRIIAAHLGNGASLCAMKDGRSVATTTGFSALEGLPMGTRCGSLDAGVVFYMLREMKLSPEAAERLLYAQSGLLGVSGVSNDMRVLRKEAATNAAARQAIDLFVYRILRETGSLIAALGGVDGFVFTAGIGENDPATRAEVMQGLAWAGFELDEAANAAGGPWITRGSGPSAWVVPTNEEEMIARGMRAVLTDGRSRLAS